MARHQSTRRPRAMEIDSTGPSYSSPSRGNTNRSARRRPTTSGSGARGLGTLNSRYA